MDKKITLTKEQLEETYHYLCELRSGDGWEENPDLAKIMKVLSNKLYN